MRAADRRLGGYGVTLQPAAPALVGATQMGKTRRYSALGIAWLLLSLGSAEHAGASTELLVPAGQPVVLTGTQTHSGPVDKAAERPAGFSDQGQAQEASSVDHKAVLLWPKSLEQFQAEYPSWPQWLGSPDPYALALRDELLTSARALAAIIPDLSVEADQPDSDLIVVTGHPATVGALVERLRDHPLLAQVTGDSPAYREEARAAWRERAGNASKAPYPSSLVVNIRNTWVTNTVWGYAAPGMDVTVRVIRDSSHTLSTTATADDAGRYEAYFPWEIREGDVIELQTGTEERRIPVIPLRATDMSSPAFLLGVAGTGPAVSAKLDVTIGRGWQEVGVGREGAFRLDLQASPPTPGTRGFLAYRDPAGVRIFAPFATPVVNVRRDTSYGLPYGGAHSAGISSIVWGSATPGAALEVTLTRAESLLASRTTSADMTGYFSISVDRLIEDGDVIQVSDGASQRTVEAPTLTYRADPVARVVTGIGPPGIASTVPGAPHTLQVSLGGLSLQVTTTSEGEFTADFGTRPYFAGLLGAMQYITPEGDRVFKPVFVADPLVRGRLDDWRADVILGQPDFDQITPNEVVGNKLFNPSGVYVDRSSQPNRVYVYDAGNNRVLGLSHLGVCLGGANAGSACTSDSDCPASSCQIEADRAADLVLGQPSFTASACNGDSGIQGFPDTALSSASSLCGMLAEGVSILESGSAATMATDLAGNLYLPDIYNHRVLRYDDPFEKDRIADHAWGQTDFSGNHCNRGAAGPDNQSLCLAPLPSYGDIMSGVAIDAVGNLWVTDTRNSRVLRFPYDAILGAPAREADLVLGQPDFSTAVSGEGLSQMSRPTSVRVDASGVVYVADALSGSADKGRVLIFEPPFSNGMFASGLLGSGGGGPTGLEIDPAEGLWVNDSQYQGVQYFVDGTLRRTLNSAPGRIWGGIGVDRDGSVMVTGWDPQEVQVYSMPTYTLESTFLKADEYGFFNRTGSRGFHEGLGLEIAAGQLIYADSSRLLFWNNPWNPANYEPADGVLGEPDFQTREAWGPPFGRMRADLYGHLWVIQGDGSKAWVNGYSLPLSQGEEPIVVLSPPIPVQGGGETTWSWSLFLGGIDVQPSCDCLWLADKENHRVLRVRNVSSHPVIDVVLGQLDISGSQCNQGRGPNYPSRDSLCHPGGLAFDKEGNLFVADHNLETTGNWRLLEYDAGTIPDMPASAVFGVPATRVFGRGGDFSQPYCLPLAEDPVCGPWEPAFDASGRMVVAFNGYLGPRFPLIYQNPLNNPFPISALADFHSQPLSARFDPFGNLYVLDTTRHRILIYRRNEVQIYQLSGTIRTQEGDPIPGVSLETVGYASSAVTDGSGRYALMGLVTGERHQPRARAQRTQAGQPRRPDVQLRPGDANRRGARPCGGPGLRGHIYPHDSDDHCARGRFHHCRPRRSGGRRYRRSGRALPGQSPAWPGEFGACCVELEHETGIERISHAAGRSL